MMLRPAVVDFLDLAELGDYPDLFIEELQMQENSALSGLSIRAAAYATRWHVLVLAIRAGGGDMTFRPPADQALQGGDTLIVAGHRQDLGRLEKALQAAA